ncbi:hypothetical protein GP486_007990, partial [Trichoglossum hirsutum]
MSGRAARRNNTASDIIKMHLHWSPAGDTLYYKDGEFNMGQFKSMIQSQVDGCERLLEDLMLGLPLLNIDLKRYSDSMTCSKTGYSFIKHIDNDLEEQYLNLAEQARGTLTYNSSGKGTWKAERCIDYLKSKDTLLRQLMTLMHYTGGQPGRGTEIGGIRSRNSSTEMRNIYLLKGCLCYIIGYSKARTSTNKCFYVARFLPAASYRHVVIAITRRHIKAMVGRFNPYTDQSDDTTTSVIFSWQAEHRHKMNITSYALDRTFPDKLQPELLMQYHLASLIWHEWLELVEHLIDYSDEGSVSNPFIIPNIDRKNRTNAHPHAIRNAIEEDDESDVPYDGTPRRLRKRLRAYSSATSDIDEYGDIKRR